MNDVAKEYLAPDPGEEKRKAFTLSPAPEDLTHVILQSRWSALTDPDLSTGAIVLFTYLLDMSLNRRVSDWRGVVKMSEIALSQDLHVTDRTIRRWGRELLKKNFVWITKIPRPNTWPMNVYHVTALDEPGQRRQQLSGDGVWGTGRGRSDAGRMHGAADRGQICPVAVLPGLAAETVALTGAVGQECPVAEDKNVPCERTEMSSERGQKCPLPADENVLSERTKTSSPSGQKCPLAADNNVLSQRTEMSDKGIALSREQEHPKEQKGEAPPLEASKEGGKAVRLSGAEIILREKELKRIEAKIEALRGQKPWSEAEKAQVRTLKERKAEVLKLLGMIV